MATQKIKLFANALATHFYGNKPESPCVCIGASKCCRIDCALVWEHFLECPKDIEIAFEVLRVINKD